MATVIRNPQCVDDTPTGAYKAALVAWSVTGCRPFDTSRLRLPAITMADAHDIRAFVLGHNTGDGSVAHYDVAIEDAPAGPVVLVGLRVAPSLAALGEQSDRTIRLQAFPTAPYLTFADSMANRYPLAKSAAWTKAACAAEAAPGAAAVSSVVNSEGAAGAAPADPSAPPPVSGGAASPVDAFVAPPMMLPPALMLRRHAVVERKDRLVPLDIWKTAGIAWSSSFGLIKQKSDTVVLPLPAISNWDASLVCAFVLAHNPGDGSAARYEARVEFSQAGQSVVVTLCDGDASAAPVRTLRLQSANVSMATIASLADAACLASLSEFGTSYRAYMHQTDPSSAPRPAPAAGSASNSSPVSESAAESSAVLPTVAPAVDTGPRGVPNLENATPTPTEVADRPATQSVAAQPVAASAIPPAPVMTATAPTPTGSIATPTVAPAEPAPASGGGLCTVC